MLPGEQHAAEVVAGALESGKAEQGAAEAGALDEAIALAPEDIVQVDLVHQPQEFHLGKAAVGQDDRLDVGGDQLSQGAQQLLLGFGHGTGQ